MKDNKDLIIGRIQKYLYSLYAKDIKSARVNEVYDCLCRALMEDIGKTWVKSKALRDDKDYYVLSFEYLPGKFIRRNIHRLKIKNDVTRSLLEIGFDLDEVLACEKEADLGIGDIGMGASNLINELANQKKRAVAYALRYENGNLKQKIINGRQVEYTDFWLEQGSNWEHKKSFSYILDIAGRKNKSIAYDMPILSDGADYVNTLRLFKSEALDAINIDEFSRGDFLNAYDNYINVNAINKFLYLDDSTYEGKLLRLKQEYFYSVSSIRDVFRRYKKRHGSIKGLGENIRIFCLDIHPTLSLIEFLRILHQEYDLSLVKAIKICRKVFDHIAFSITDDSVEVYSLDMLKNINQEMADFIMKVHKTLSMEDGVGIVKNGNIYFRNINKYLSNSYNYLSKIISDKRENEIGHSYLNYGTDRILYASSNNLRLTDLLKSYNIKSFRPDEIKKIKDLIGDKDFIQSLDKIKYNNKESLACYINKKLGERINPYSLFDIQFSIIHESKRQILNCLAIAYKYYMLRSNRNLKVTPTTYIFSGKANEGYFMAKETIKFILALKHMIDKDNFIRERIKIIFIEDLDVEKVRRVIPAVDLYSNLTLASLDNQNFHILNSIFNMANILSTRGGIIDNLNMENAFYDFGASFDDLNKPYNANDFYYSNDIVRFTVDSLLNEDYSTLPYDFKTIYEEILMYNDSFRIFYDLEDLIKKRSSIEKDYLDLKSWTKRQLKNILWANEFRLDGLINNKYGLNDEENKI